MTKFDKQSLCKKNFFGMTLLHAHAHYICIVCATYKGASVKALVQVDFLMYELSKHKHNPYLIGNENTKAIQMAKFRPYKWLSLISSHFSKNISGMTLLHASVKDLVQVDLLMYALSKHKHNTYLIENRIIHFSIDISWFSNLFETDETKRPW